MPFELFSLRGGLNDSDPPSALADDACDVAENVEFVRSTLGERRRGCEDLADYPASFAALDVVVWMHRHLPTNDEADAQLWALKQNLTAPYAHQMAYRDSSGWHDVTLPDTPDFTVPNGHRMSAVSLHGKLFLAYKSSVDRLHVWDGSSVRRAGLAPPAAAPTGANTGAGSLNGTRYYRVRYVVMSGSTVLLRSEPSAVLTFSPSGGGSAVRITKPADTGENATHWEIEASLDNANFYRTGRVVVGTTTADDTTPYATGYATTNPLSEDVGDYTVIPSATLLSADADRLMPAGSWSDTAQASRLRWTPVYGGPGVGNDERLEDDTDPFLDLDGFSGGDLVGLSRAVNGYLFAMKLGHVYKILRQGDRAKAYEAFPVSTANGSLAGGMIEAIDQTGHPVQYYLDPKTGPWRAGANGLQWCGRDIETLWSRVNIDATVACHGVYYKESRQVHIWLALDDAEYPNAKIVLHVNEMRNTDEGARRGWATVPKNDVIAVAHCSAMFAPNVDTSDPRELNLVPYIGIDDSADPILRCDVGENDNGTTYRGRVRSKPFFLSGLLNQHGVMAGALLARADSGTTVYAKVTRDFGAETKTVSADLTPGGSETHVIRFLDSFAMSEMRAVQLELGDLDGATPSGQWEINGFAMKARPEAKA